MKNFNFYKVELAAQIALMMFCFVVAVFFAIAASWPARSTCDQAALDKHSAEIGAYEITCEELGEL
jgi:hypothetical protein